MRYAHILVVVFAAVLNAVTFADTCTVTTGVELQTALNNHCQHIIIPATDGQSNPVVINVPFQFNGNQVSTISIGDVHDGMQLTINGTINWVGGNNSGYKVVQINGASNITIDGSGLFTSSEDPASNAYIAWAIRILDATNISISDLSFENLSSMMQQESGYVNGLSLSNLHGEELTRYGVFISDGSNIAIEDCRVGDANNSQITGTYNEHGFRIYARTYPDTGNVSILNCSAHYVADTGLWIVEGDDVIVDGFTSNRPFRIGPNFSCKDAGLDTGDGNGNPQQRVRRAEVKNIDVLNVQVENGTMGAYLQSVTGASSIGIGRVPGLRKATLTRWSRARSIMSIGRMSMWHQASPPPIALVIM